MRSTQCLMIMASDDSYKCSLTYLGRQSMPVSFLQRPTSLVEHLTVARRFRSAALLWSETKLASSHWKTGRSPKVEQMILTPQGNNSPLARGGRGASVG